MKLAVLVDYEDAGNLQLVDVDSLSVRQLYCPLIDDGLADLIYYDFTKKIACQAMVERIESEAEEEGDETGDETGDDWVITWRDIRLART